MAKKLLVTGGSGFLGQHLTQLAPTGWRLVNTWHSNPVSIAPKSEALPLNLIDRDAIWRVLKTVKPDVVAHLAAASSPAYCEANPKESRALNVESTGWLAEMCADLHCKLLFTSSEQVYDGKSAPYFESPTPSPMNEYGRQKLEAEQTIQAIASDAIIVRLAVLYGQAGNGVTNFLQQWLATWRSGGEVMAFNDEIRSFLSGPSAVEGLFLLLGKGAEGIFNLGGSEAMSRFDFALRASTAFDLPEAKITEKSQQDVELSVFRPADLTLDLSKITGLGFKPEGLNFHV